MWMVIVLSSREESLILALIQAHEYSKSPHFSTLDSKVSTFVTWELSFKDWDQTVNLLLIVKQAAHKFLP